MLQIQITILLFIGTIGATVAGLGIRLFARRTDYPSTFVSIFFIALGVAIVVGVIFRSWQLSKRRPVEQDTKVDDNEKNPGWVGRPEILGKHRFFGRNDDLSELARHFKDSQAVVISGTCAPSSISVLDASLSVAIIVFLCTSTCRDHGRRRANA